MLIQRIPAQKPEGCYSGLSGKPALWEQMTEKPSAVLPGTVDKIIKSPFPSQPEKAQITVEGGDHLYREIRIDNTLTNEKGEEVSLKPGAHVELTVAAEADATTPKNSSGETRTTSAAWHGSSPSPGASQG